MVTIRGEIMSLLGEATGITKLHITVAGMLERNQRVQVPCFRWKACGVKSSNTLAGWGQALGGFTGAIV